MKIFALVNQKGGVGKTTTAVNIATGLAVAGKKVLLLDFDSQGNATTAFGIPPEARENNSYEIMTDDNITIDESIVKTDVPNLYVIPAVIDLSACDLQLATKIGREFILQKKFAAMKQKFDYVFIDCPPSLGLLTINAMASSDYVLIPLQCEFYSLEGLSYLLNTIKLVQDNLNEKLDIGGIILTMYDRRNKLTQDVEAEIVTHFRDKLFKSYIPRNVKLSEAPSHGKPGIIYDHRSSGAQAYMLLAREILKRFG